MLHVLKSEVFIPGAGGWGGGLGPLFLNFLDPPLLDAISIDKLIFQMIAVDWMLTCVAIHC